MATQKSTARRIVGAIIQNGHLFKAGEEDALAPLLSESDLHRLASSGHIDGDWSAASASTANADEDDEGTDGTDSDEEEGLPPLAEMESHLETLTDADDIKALRKSDKRKGAKPMYAARLAALKSEE